MANKYNMKRYLGMYFLTQTPLDATLLAYISLAVYAENDKKMKEENK